MSDKERSQNREVESELTDAEITQELLKVYGPELTTFMTHTDIDNPGTIPLGSVEVVSKWAKGTVVPSEEAATTLRNIFDTTQVLRKLEDNETIRNWVMGMDPNLDDIAPARLFRSRPRDVRAAAELFVQEG